MINYKDYIGNYFKGKKVHIHCDCVVKLDIIGFVVGYEINNNEVIFNIDNNGKIIKIGENTPKLNIEIL